MKINALIFVLTFFCFGLSAQVDKIAITTDFVKGWATDQKHDIIKKHFSPNLIFTWHGGNNWPDGSDGSLEKFWEFYIKHCKQVKEKFSDLDVKKSDNETYAFVVWESTINENEQHPEWVGTTAKGPGAYRIIWEDDKIKHLYFYSDIGGRQAQHDAQAAEKKN